jgi:hypothetical protein
MFSGTTLLMHSGPNTHSCEYRLPPLRLPQTITEPQHALWQVQKRQPWDLLALDRMFHHFYSAAAHATAAQREAGYPVFARNSAVGAYSVL